MQYELDQSCGLVYHKTFSVMTEKNGLLVGNVLDTLKSASVREYYTDLIHCAVLFLLLKCAWYECVLDDNEGDTFRSHFSLICCITECYSCPYIMHAKHVNRKVIEI
jgi:hypothetical protein